MNRRNLVVRAPYDVALVEEPLPEVPDGGLLLQTLATGLSAGTEVTYVRGDNPGLFREHDPELGLFRTVDRAPVYPVPRLGYMEVARVVESQTAAFEIGTVVASAYGHATAHVSDPVLEHVVPLPDDLDPLLGVYVAHLGPICANGLLHAAADAVGPPVSALGEGVEGRRVLVTGAGLIGLLTAMMAVDNGADEVAVVDADPRRLALARRLGLLAIPADADVAGAVKTRWRHGSRDHGADVVFQCRGRPFALAIALRAARPQGTIVDLAFYTDGADEVRLGEEFHHNGLSLRSAQIGRTPRGTSGHWDRHRLSAETIRFLGRRGADVRDHLLTDVLPLEEAPRLLTEIAEHRRHVLSAVFVCDGSISSFASSGQGE